MAAALVLGSTGMVGQHILSTLRSASPHVSTIQTITRRDPPEPPTAKVPTATFVNKDLTTWAPHVSELNPTPAIVFSALATTRGAAGGFDKQYALEHDLNIELAKAAREKGSKVYVLISAASANANAFFAYTKMKGEIEEHIKELGFEHTIIVRPGLIAGHREESRIAEGIVRKIAAVAGSISNSLKDPWAQESDVIARAAVNAGLKALTGEIKDKVTIVDQAGIIRLGRTEWKDFE